MQNTKTPIERAIDIAGGMTKMARDLELTGHATVYQWSKTRVPAEKCPDIEALTGIRCEELRPDVNWAVLRRLEISAAPTNKAQVAIKKVA